MERGRGDTGRDSATIWVNWMYSGFRCVTGVSSAAMNWIAQVLCYVRYALSVPSNWIFGYLYNPSLRPNQNQDEAMQNTKMKTPGIIRGEREV